MTSCSKTEKSLVLYYSQTGTTVKVAEEIARQTGADIERFDVIEAYDGSFDETISRCIEEQKSGFVPSLKPLKSDVSNYDIIYIGYPVWFGTCATPVFSLLKSIDFSGKTIVPFCTFGSGGLYSSASAIRCEIPGADVRNGYGVRSIRLDAVHGEVYRFLVENGYISGTVEKLEKFSQQEPVTDDDKSIFDAACSGYQFPLGEPFSVGSRKTSKGTDYRFVVNASAADGTQTENIIYITVEDGSDPVFTMVVGKGEEPDSI